MARKRNEEYIGDSDDGEFEEEPVDTFEDPEDFEDDVTDEGKNCILIFATNQKCDCVFGVSSALNLASNGLNRTIGVRLTGSQLTAPC
jgi:hypothetical protein